MTTQYVLIIINDIACILDELLNNLNEDNQLAPPVNRTNQQRLEALYGSGEGRQTNNNGKICIVFFILWSVYLHPGLTLLGDLGKIVALELPKAK